MTAQNREQIAKKLHELKLEHQSLDNTIRNLAHQPAFDQINLQRLKKRKLFIKDQITKIENNMLPDIIA